MRLRTPLVTLAALALAVCAAARAQDEPQSDQKVIDDFVVTRGMGFTSPAKQKQAKPAPTPRRTNRKSASGVASAKGSAAKGGAAAKPGGAGSQASAQTEVAGDTAAGDGGSPVEGAQLVQAGLRPIGLGYTLLMKDAAGSLSVVDTSREFKTNDELALAFETNADGYLYLFSAQNGRDPVLLFPDARVDGGANAVQMHARATFPTGADAEEEYFITMEDPPANEHLFVVFSRRPLPDVPTGEALVKHCGKDLENCEWRPTPAQWARILGTSRGRRVNEAKNTQLAQAAAPDDLGAMIHRGLKVKKGARKPAVVRVNDSADADVLVTEIVLTHK